jgi:hypothetical protein
MNARHALNATDAVSLSESAIENELPILVGNNRVARIPFPMSEEDFDLLLETLQLWKRRIVKAREPSGVGVSCEPSEK